jgi:outer membrane protein TolC
MGALRRSLRWCYDGSVANYRQTVLTSFQQIEGNFIVLRKLNTEFAQQHEATESAEEALRLFQNRYAGGVDTYLQVVTSQTTALANERNDIDLMTETRSKRAADQAVGGDGMFQRFPRCELADKDGLAPLGKSTTLGSA